MNVKYYVYDKWSDEKKWELEWVYENKKNALYNAKLNSISLSSDYMTKVVYKKKIVWKSY